MAGRKSYKTLLLEQADFAKGTSSRSTKLVHGGVRYLAQGDVASASNLIDDAIAHPFDIPSKERPPFSDLRLAPLGRVPRRPPSLRVARVPLRRHHPTLLTTPSAPNPTRSPRFPIFPP